MAKKQKEKVKLIESVQFDDVERAQKTLKLAKFNQIRILIGLAFAAVGTILAACGIWGDPEKSTLFFTFAIVLAIPAYIVGGGIGKALKTAGKITKVAWFLIPAFPVDVLLAIVAFFFSIVAFLFIPIVFVGLNYIQHKKTLDAATSYLAQCGYAASTIEE